MTYDIVILHGPAGAGKGTVAKVLIELDYHLIGAGDEIRNYISTNGEVDPMAKRMKSLLDQGKNVSTQDLLTIVERKFLSLSDQKVLGDGLVREEDQAVWLDQFATNSLKEVLFLNLEVPFETILKRLLNRYFVPGNNFPFSSFEEAKEHCQKGEEPFMRDDDNQDAIQSRFSIYKENLPHIQKVCTQSKWIDYIELNGDQKPHKVLEDLASII
ncbi:MAG: nucleoside monophosphate kinase [Patescibacteria group bacterium]